MFQVETISDRRGFTTVDFSAKLKSISKQSAFAMDQQSDLKTMIIQQSGADIYVEAEMNVFFSQSGNSVKILITAYDVSTGNSLSNIITIK